MLIIANGMLRSGSTLQYNIAASVLETTGLLDRAGFFGNLSKPQTRAKLEKAKAGEGWTIIKTHDKPIEPDFYDDRVIVLYSYRDLRDVAASMKKKWGFSYKKILSDIEAMIDVERHIRNIPTVLVQRYEDLYTDLSTAAREVATHLKVNIADKDIDRISEENSLESRVEYESKRVMLMRPRSYDPRTLLHPDHISSTRGSAGHWNEVFSPEEIQKFNHRFKKWLVQHGYEPDRSLDVVE